MNKMNGNLANVIGKEIKNLKGYNYLLIYSDSCPHCTSFIPTYIKTFKNDYVHKSYALHAETNKNYSVETELYKSFVGYPTVLLLNDGKVCNSWEDDTFENWVIKANNQIRKR
jgi:hypothetical protein